MIEGVVRSPSAFSITRGLSPSRMATQELVVPKSIPIILDILIPLSQFYCGQTHKVFAVVLYMCPTTDFSSPCVKNKRLNKSTINFYSQPPWQDVIIVHLMCTLSALQK